MASSLSDQSYKATNSSLFSSLSSNTGGTSNINNNGSSMNKNSSGTSDRGNDYTLADVYDDAAIIGSELEKIIASYGSDVLKDLMPKVINVLELLESLTIRNEKENEELNELKARINSLEFEKAQRINEREKFEKVRDFKIEKKKDLENSLNDLK